MSAEASLTFYGIKYSIEAEEAEGVDIRKHPLVQKARAHNLTFFFENVGGAGAAEYCLYIGAKLGVTGPENEFKVEKFGQEVRGILSDVESKLTNAGFAESPKLYMQWLPDV